MNGSCLLYRQSSGKAAIHLLRRGSNERKFVCGRTKTSDHKVLRAMVVTAEWIECGKAEAWHSDGTCMCRSVGVPEPSDLQDECRSVGVSERVMLQSE